MNELGRESRVKLKDEVLFQEVHGQSVLLDMQTGVYFGLDQTGTRIWQLFGENKSISDVVSVVTDEFDVTEETCSTDVITLVGKLRDQGLLTVEQS